MKHMEKLGSSLHENKLLHDCNVIKYMSIYIYIYILV